MHVASHERTPEHDGSPERDDNSNRDQTPEPEQVAARRSNRERLTKNELIHQLDRQEQSIERQERLLNLLLEQRQLPPPQRETLKMVNPRPYCGGAKELDSFLSHLHQNHQLHATLFPDDATKVAHALNLLGTWAEHPKPELRKTKAIDPSS